MTNNGSGPEPEQKETILKPEQDTNNNIKNKTEELKTDCEEISGHHELDTSQGDFTTIAAGILLALAVYALIPAITGIRLGDYPTVIVYGGFLILVVIFWLLAEKIKEHHQKKQ